MPFILDSGSSYTQIDLNYAIGIGFKSHQSLFGSSVIANGAAKVDLLSKVQLSILVKKVDIDLGEKIHFRRSVGEGRLST